MQRWLNSFECAVLGFLAVSARGAGDVPITGRSARIEIGVRIPPHGTVRGDLFFSAALGVEKHFMVYLPPSYGRNANRRYPVVYMLHGLGGSETDWLSHGSIDAVADSLFAGGVPEFIVIMPDGDDGWYTTWAKPGNFRECADAVRSEAPDRYCVQTQRYDDYIGRDLVGFIDGHYRTIADRAHRGIGGLSMGGYGAIVLALKYPNVFGAAASHSGPMSALYTGGASFRAPPRYATRFDDLKDSTGKVWSGFLRYFGDDLDRWRANEPARLTERLTAARMPTPAMFLDCGLDDDLLAQNRVFDWELTQLGLQHKYAEWPGGHNWRYWHTHVSESLAWLGRQLWESWPSHRVVRTRHIREEGA